jgi:hypothetical protein
MNMAKEYSKMSIDDCLDSGKNFIKPKMKILIENLLDKTESEQVIKTSCDIGAFRAVEKLKDWMSLNLNEQIFHQDLKQRRFKKKTETTVTQNVAKNKTNELDKGVEEDLGSSAEKPVFNLDCVMPSEIFNKLKVSRSLKNKKLNMMLSNLSF